MTKPVIIAEAGVNHNGDIELAKKLISVAAEAGADYVKFQSFKTDNLVTKDAEMADYQKENIGATDSQYNMLKKLELSEEDHKLLIDACKSAGIKFLSTAFCEDTADFLEDKVDLYKVPSGEITNIPYLKHLAAKNKEIVISTGMATLNEIEDAINAVKSVWGENPQKLTVLHCTTAYPTPDNEVNLKAMLSIAKKFNVEVGYSDHTLGIEIPIAATALGATLIEKHFTLDRNMEGPDHKASLEPNELAAMVSGIHKVSNALGDGVKAPTQSESKNRKIARKSLHFSRGLKAGHTLTREDLKVSRPEDGLAPKYLDVLIGKELALDVSAEQAVLDNSISGGVL